MVLGGKGMPALGRGLSKPWQEQVLNIVRNIVRQEFYAADVNP
jgi:hypothetical protein